MNYYKLVAKLSERIGINKKLFDLDFNQQNGTGIVIIDQKKIDHYFVTGYELKQNFDESWKSISLYIPNEIAMEFFNILNILFEQQGEGIIDLENIPNEIIYTDDKKNFNTLLISKRKSDYRVEFAKKNE